MRHEFDLNHHFTITNYYYFSTTRRITDHQIQSTTTTNWSNYLPERLYSLKLKIWCFDLTLQSRRVKTEIVEFENWMDAASLDRGWTSIFNRWSSSIQKLEVWFEKKSIGPTQIISFSINQMSWPNAMEKTNNTFNGRIFFLSESLKCYLVGGGNLNGGDDDSGSSWGWTCLKTF